MGELRIEENGIAALISAIYDAAADFGRWPDALRLIAETCGARAAVLTRQGENSGQSWSVAPLCDSAYYESYARHYHRINPIWYRTSSSQAGTVQTDDMIMPRNDFTRTEFYNDFLVPQRLGSVLNAVALVEEGRQTAIALHRRKQFEPEHVQLYRLLVPHLQRAVQLNIKIAEMQMCSTASLEALDRGTLLVNKSARVVFADYPAERLCTSSGPLKISEGILCAHRADDTALLHSIITRSVLRGSDAGAGGQLYLPCESGKRPISILVIPLRSDDVPFFAAERAVAVVFVTDPNRQSEAFSSKIQRQFGLTPAETAFAVELLDGHGIQAAADRLGIMRSTGRTHLARIFEKTHTHRQAELVRLMHQHVYTVATLKHPQSIRPAELRN